jgi:hypothetical protein
MPHAGVTSSTSGWIRPALFFLAVSVAATAIAVVVSVSRESSPSATTTTTTVPATTPTTTTTRTTTTATAPTTTTPAPHPVVVPGTWPAGTRGYTVVLESIPLAAGRAFAASRARTARQAGLPRVGVLVSSDFASLHPGYYVVFSGVYDSSARASAALPNAHEHGFPDAYQARVAR